MKILVTGGAGFLGSHLCKKLIDQGNEVVCVDNFFTGRKKNVDKLLQSEKFSIVEQDINVPFKITGLDRIYNLACPASPPAYQNDPIFTWKTSVIGVMNMLELARKNNNCRILQSSTSEVYGDPLEHPQREGYWGNVNPVGTRSCYDEGKRAAETLIMDYYRKYKLPVRIIRIFNTYGPNMDPFDGRVVSNFVVQALTNKDITIFGDGSQTRSFQYVDDLIEVMIRMMENEVNFTGPVNTGNPVEFTIKELAEMVLKMIPESKSKIVYKDIPDDDPKVRKPDGVLAKEKLSWEPKIKLEEGLIPTIAYFKSEVL
jgi:UDP-glucuronate decarboxylase